jgi:aminoglycoside 3-N-acetyltransferase
MSLKKILELSPRIEFHVRSLYWGNPWVHSLLGRFARKAYHRKSREGARERIDFGRVEAFLREHGVRSGDILIVHSSIDALKPCGLNPKQIVDRLLALVGEEGTLAMPAIPYFREEPTGIERMSDAICATTLTFNVQKTRTWTGALPTQMMRDPRAIRSRHPLNTMVAIGRHAAEMMENNIEGHLPTGCGPNSSWKYCVDHNAKIVALGADMAHSLTMIHVAEDSYETAWPVSDWHRVRKFEIIDRDFRKTISVRERRPKWAIHYSERTLQKDMRTLGIMSSFDIESLHLDFLESSRLLEFLNSRKQRAYPYFGVTTKLPGS